MFLANQSRAGEFRAQWLDGYDVIDYSWAFISAPLNVFCQWEVFSFVYMCIWLERTSEYSGMSVFYWACGKWCARVSLSLYFFVYNCVLNCFVEVTWCHFLVFCVIRTYCLHDYIKTLSSHIHSEAEELSVIKNEQQNHLICTILPLN